MEDEVEERTMSTCHVMLTQDHDRAHRHRGDDNGRTATPGLLHEPRLVDEVHQREAPLGGGEEEAQATVLTVATVEAGAGLRVDREAEEDTGGDEIVMLRVRVDDSASEYVMDRISSGGAGLLESMSTQGETWP